MLDRHTKTYLLLGLAVAGLAAVIVQAALTWKKPSPPPGFEAVTKVFDGDTIEVRRGGRLEKVRLLGIDTPETVDPRRPVQCFGRDASRRTKQLLSRMYVRLETDPAAGEHDKYHRLLRYVWRQDGLLVNESLIRDGYALEYTYRTTAYRHQAEFKMAEAEARAARRGLWSPQTCNGNTKRPAGVVGGGMLPVWQQQRANWKQQPSAAAVFGAWRQLTSG